MPQANDWLFDILWDLSDKAHDAELPALAEKLEEAMDTYLLESQPGGPAAAFRSQRYADADRRAMEIARTKTRTVQSLNVLVAQTRAKSKAHQQARAAKRVAIEKPKPEFASTQQTVQSFAWPY